VNVVRTEPADPKDAGLFVAWASADVPGSPAAVLLQLGTERYLLDAEAGRSLIASVTYVVELLEAGATPPPETLIPATASAEEMAASFTRTQRKD
jgi:hypothetical protein